MRGLKGLKVYDIHLRQRQRTGDQRKERKEEGGKERKRKKGKKEKRGFWSAERRANVRRPHAAARARVRMRQRESARVRKIGGKRNCAWMRKEIEDIKFWRNGGSLLYLLGWERGRETWRARVGGCYLIMSGETREDDFSLPRSSRLVHDTDQGDMEQPSPARFSQLNMCLS